MLFSHEISLPARVLLRSTPLTAAPVMLEHGPGPDSDLGRASAEGFTIDRALLPIK
jgi:hypothetical protein